MTDNRIMRVSAYAQVVTELCHLARRVPGGQARLTALLTGGEEFVVWDRRTEAGQTVMEARPCDRMAALLADLRREAEAA